MSNLFSGSGLEGGDDDVRSLAGDAGGGRSDPAAGGAVFRGDARGRVLKGKARPTFDSRKYQYDVVRGRASKFEFSVSKDDRMSVADASALLHRIHELCGVATENEDVLCTFDRALFFCHTINGSSVLSPGRSKFQVLVGAGDSAPVTREFDYAVVRDLLGVDFRRFFRTYADDVTQVNMAVLRDYDPNNPVSVEQHSWLQQVAHTRGMSRYPHLAHDSADACLYLNVAERQALNESKVLVIGGTPNSADRAKPGALAQSADAYDSTVGASYAPA